MKTKKADGVVSVLLVRTSILLLLVLCIYNYRHFVGLVFRM